MDSGIFRTRNHLTAAEIQIDPDLGIHRENPRQGKMLEFGVAPSEIQKVWEDYRPMFDSALNTPASPETCCLKAMG